MKNRVHAAHRPRHIGSRADVAPDNLELLEPLQVLLFACREVVEDANAVLIGQQASDQVRSDEPGAARDQDCFRFA